MLVIPKKNRQGTHRERPNWGLAQLMRPTVGRPRRAARMIPLCWCPNACASNHRGTLTRWKHLNLRADVERRNPDTRRHGCQRRARRECNLVVLKITVTGAVLVLDSAIRTLVRRWRRRNEEHLFPVAGHCGRACLGIRQPTGRRAAAAFRGVTRDDIRPDHRFARRQRFRTSWKRVGRRFLSCEMSERCQGPRSPPMSPWPMRTCRRRTIGTSERPRPRSKPTDTNA